MYRLIRLFAAACGGDVHAAVSFLSVTMGNLRPPPDGKNRRKARRFVQG